MLAPSRTTEGFAVKVAPDTGTGTSAVPVADVTQASNLDDAALLLKRERSLWNWNLGCGIVHLLQVRSGVPCLVRVHNSHCNLLPYTLILFSQAIIVLALSLTASRASSFRIPLVLVYTDWTNDYPVPAMTQRALLPFAAVTSGFAWMSAAAHFLVLLNFATYLKDLRCGINRFRWYEYAFSSSLMIALIALLYGMYDILSLVLIMSVNACMCLFGYLHEAMNKGRARADVDWTAFDFGCFAGAVPWACIFALLGSNPFVSGIPGFVWGILASYFVMFNLFPINMVCQYLQVGWWSDKYWGYAHGGYMFGEKAYQIQSLVAKSLLLWLVFGGTNQPNAFTSTPTPA